MDVYKTYFVGLLRRLYAVFSELLIPMLPLLTVISLLLYLRLRKRRYGLGSTLKVPNFTIQEPIDRSKRVKSSDWNCGRFLGEGCSGIFYEATWSSGRNISSPKSLAARKAFPAVPANVFKHEAARLVELDHPNIVKVLGWTVDRRSCSLFMDRMKYDLFCVIQKRKEAMRNGAQVEFRSTVPIPLGEAVHIMLQIAEGVKYLHEQRLTHGDLKPNNVLVDSESDLMLATVRVTDFGLTETKKRSTTLVSHEARCLQILKWKAPELFEDLLGSSTEDSENMWTEMLEAVNLTSHASSSVTMESAESKMQRADVYSFALTCSYVLGAQVPHDSNLGLLELGYEISSGARPHLPSACPKLLASLISECWDPNPSRRPAFVDICKKMEFVEMELKQSEDMAKAGSEFEHSTEPWIDNPEPISDEHEDQGKKLKKPSKALTERRPFFFDFNESGLEMKRVFAVGSHSVLYEGEWKRDDGKFHSVAIKAFSDRHFTITEALIDFFYSKGTEANLRTSRVLRPLGGTLLEDGGLALVYERCWGDLRELIDRQMLKNKDVEMPPFEQEMAVDIMLQIAEGVVELHEFGIVHRDVKSWNVLVRDLEKFSTGGSRGSISCVLIDYEATEGIWGTGFHRAPEILDGQTDDAMKFTPPMAVYSYGMTCYEILTGKFPFKGEDRKHTRDLVISGGRPELPASVHPRLRDLVERCWDANPSKRPTFQEIVLLLKNISTDHWEISLGLERGLKRDLGSV